MCPQDGSAAELGQWGAMGWGISNPIGFTGAKAGITRPQTLPNTLKKKPYREKLLYLEVPKANQNNHKQFQCSPSSIAPLGHSMQEQRGTATLFPYFAPDPLLLAKKTS